MDEPLAQGRDRARTDDGGKQPVGILTVAGLPNVPGSVDYANLVKAAGLVRAAGGTPDVAFVHPPAYTNLQLATAADDRPLISGDPTQGAPPVIPGLTIWPTPAVPTAEALVAQADQIVVAVREDATVSVSEHARFTSDGSMARVIARLDVGLNDTDGLATVGQASVARRKTA